MRLLFVAFQNSIHTARWIRQLAETDWDIHVFPSTLQGERHPLLEEAGVRLHFPRTVRFALRLARGLARGVGGAKLRSLFVDEASPIRARWLASVIRRIRPDIIHSLEMQHAGYLTLESKKYVREGFPPWIVGNWGSDIYFFGRLQPHVSRIRAVLEQCDYYTCECERDVRLATEMGLRGVPLPVLPNAGGYDLERAAGLRAPGRTSSRKTILLKGYQGWAGRALVGLQAVEMCTEQLRGYRVVIPMASREVARAADIVSKKTGLEIETLPSVSHEQVLRVLGTARVYIGLSISDAISTSLLEAMVMGAFPIQSNTACVEEWLVEGDNGLIVPPEDPQVVAAALRRALSNDALVDRAAEINARTATERLDRKVIQPRAVALYERVYQETRGVRDARRSGPQAARDHR